MRDDEESFGPYFPHPLLVPMADENSWATEVATYDHARHEVWGVQAYRGSSFGDLFSSYSSDKPLLVSEYGMDAYLDTTSGRSIEIHDTNAELGVDYQTEVVPALAKEIEAADSRRNTTWFTATTLLRGDSPDSGGGYAVIEYNDYSRYLRYTIYHRTFTDGSISYSMPGGLFNTSSSSQWSSDTVVLDGMSEEEVNTTSDDAEYQVASGLSLCSAWNGESIGTCYNISDIDGVAQELVDAFGGGDCAVDWACAAIATCYFSANERHWCAWTNKSVCEDAFNGCDVTHAPSPDYPTSWADTVETPETLSSWFDGDTASDALTKTVNGETLTLVFSDEFNEEGRDLGPGKDAKWEAVDLHYSATGDDEIYKPSGVTVSGGYASIKFETNTTYDLDNTEKEFKTAMLQGWNKFCFTGAYLEGSMNQPGKSTTSGVWSAFWTLANLGQAGYLDSTAGMWPFTYDHCDTVASEGQASWENTNLDAQNFSACGDFNAEYGFQSHVGRGVADVDVFELVVPPSWYNAERGAHLSTSLQLGPNIPQNTTHGAGLTGNCANISDTCTGIYFYQHNGHDTGMNTWCMQPGYPSSETVDILGNELQDCISAESDVYDEHFEEQHTYGLWIEPGEWAAWYLDDVLLFNVTKDALTNKTNPNNSSEAVGSRQVPYEPMYIILNIASSNSNFLPRDPSLELPVYMHVDWVRLYQNTDRHSVGCDPTDFPTESYINANLDKFKTSRCGNGQCESGECEQCPRDCQYQAACRQDCLVPRCQMLDGNLTTPAAYWLFQLNTDNSPTTPVADVDWQPGTDSMLINITESGSSAYLIAVSQSRQLLCQNFRYRVNVTARSLNGTGGFTVVVNGGSANSYADLLPDALNATFTSTDSVTVSEDFEVSSRWESGQVAIQFGAQGNDNTVIELQQVSLCPIPSRAQMCGLAPHQAASTADAALTKGDSRVTAG